MAGLRNGILFVTNTLVPGGAEHVLMELAGGMLRVPGGRYRPVVACLKSRGSQAGLLDELGVPVYENLLNDKYDWRVVFRLARLMYEERIAVVVPVGSGGDRMFWAALAANITGAKCVVWSHVYPQEGFAGFQLPNRALYRLVDRFVALGRRHREALVWQENVPAGKIEVIHNGVDIRRYDRPMWRERARSILGLADDQVFAVAMVANLREDKRHDVFINAAKRVVERHANVHFFVIGDGPNSGKVQVWARISGLLGKHLSLLGERDDVDRLLPGLDLLCVCSGYQECLSLTALQAMAAGVPVLSNRIGSMDEAIGNNRTGFFYDALNPQVLSEKMLHLVEEKQLLQAVAQRAHRLASEKFCVERMTERFCRLWDELLGK